MLIYGAGGHAKVVRSILSACGEEVKGIFDDRWHSIKLQGCQVVREYSAMVLPEEELIITIGSNHDRRRVAEKLHHAFGTAIHPTAILDPTVCIGQGVVIVHRAIVQADCRIGNHVIVNTAAIADHECVLGDFVHVGPGATLCGGVRVGECTLVGAGSVILPGVSIGRECNIGAGSIVLRDVPDKTTVVGNPARIIHK